MAIEGIISLLRGALYGLNLGTIHRAHGMEETRRPTWPATARRIPTHASRGIARKWWKGLATVRGREGGARGIGRGDIFVVVFVEFLRLLLLLLSPVGRGPEHGQYGRHLVMRCGLSRHPRTQGHSRAGSPDQTLQGFDRFGCLAKLD
jgi:hypothetical protein